MDSDTDRVLASINLGVMVKAMDCGIVIREFVLQSRYYVHFRANTLRKIMNPLILPAMGSHSTNTLEKGINPIILPPAMGKYQGRLGFYSLGEATSVGEGQL